jgi:hypothetical protein
VGLVTRGWDNRTADVVADYDYFDLTGARVLGNGLKGEYFDNMTLEGPPVVTRLDPQVDFAWGEDSPAPEIAPDQFSVRWTGQVEAPATADVTFHTLSDDGIRLWVNDQLLVDNWTDHGPTWDDSVPIFLTAGQRYTLTLEYYENGGSAEAHLEWSSPSMPQQVIPSGWLYSDLLTTTPPVADFYATPLNGYAPLIVQFTDASTGTVDTRLWDFGDGYTSTLSNPAHQCHLVSALESRL